MCEIWNSIIKSENRSVVQKFRGRLADFFLQAGDGDAEEILLYSWAFRRGDRKSREADLFRRFWKFLTFGFTLHSSALEGYAQKCPFKVFPIFCDRLFNKHLYCPLLSSSLIGGSMYKTYQGMHKLLSKEPVGTEI